MQLKAEREVEGQSRPAGAVGETWTGAGPAKSHLKELTRLMEGARTEAGKNTSQLLQKLDNIKQASSTWASNMPLSLCCFSVFVDSTGVHGI